MENVHSCQACNDPFPDGTSKRRRYCNDACKMRAKRERDRAATPRSGAAEKLATQNIELRQQLSRSNAELAKVHDRAMGYRRETQQLRSEKTTLLDVRRNSLLHFHTQHQQLRSKYRQAHLLVTRFGQHLSTLSGGTPPTPTTWHDPENVSSDMLRGPLPSDTTNSSKLTQLVADTMAQLEELVGLSHHLPRTRRDTAADDDTTQATAGPTTTTPDDVVSTQRTELEQLRQELDTANAIVAKQRQQMRLAKDAHTKLREQYTQQRQLNTQLTADREHTKLVIKQWLTLAREMYRRTGGRPTEKRHQEIIATWRQYETWAKGSTRP